ncbi:MAG: PAS domain-containing protein [Leptolyngbyaceae cyanobacterium]
MNEAVSEGCDEAAVQLTQSLVALWQKSPRAMCRLRQQPDGFVITDANLAMAQLLSRSVEQLRHCAIQDVLATEDSDETPYQQAIKTDQAITFEDVITVAEQRYWFSIEAVPLPPTESGEAQLMVTFTDISSYKQTEQQLTQSAQILQQVIDNVPFIILWKDRNSVFQGYNRRFPPITGCDSSESLIGKTDYEMPWLQQETEQYLACDRQVMATDTPQLNIIEPQLQANGREAWLSTSKIPLHDDDGEVNGILLVIEDITERKTTEAALRQSEERFRSLFEGTPMIGMQIYDHQRRVIGWNQASEELYGYTRTEAMGRQLEDLIIPDALREPVIQAVEDWVHQGPPIPAGELTLRDKEGHPVEVFSSHIMLKNLQGDPELYCLDLDIRDRKKAETTLRQAQLQMIHGEKMSSLGKMVAGVAHEINNPISFIDGNLLHAKEYIQDLLHLVMLYQNAYPNPGKEIQNALQTLDLDFIRKDFFRLAASMQSGTDRIRHIVDSLRNFSRLDETGAKAVDIHEGLNSTLTILRHRLQTTELPIQVVKNYSSLSPVVCYPGPLNQVFMNILTNAIDALVAAHDDKSLTDVPKIEITTCQNRQQTVITICDNGPGISNALKEKIFDPFFTTKAVGHGTGMGLAISYQIVTHQHHGQLTVDSVLGQGACFKICLPMDI